METRAPRNRIEFVSYHGFDQLKAQIGKSRISGNNTEYTEYTEYITREYGPGEYIHVLMPRRYSDTVYSGHPESSTAKSPSQ